MIMCSVKEEVEPSRRSEECCIEASERTLVNWLSEGRHDVSIISISTNCESREENEGAIFCIDFSSLFRRVEALPPPPGGPPSPPTYTCPVGLKK